MVRAQTLLFVKLTVIFIAICWTKRLQTHFRSNCLDPNFAGYEKDELCTYSTW